LHEDFVTKFGIRTAAHSHDRPPSSGDRSYSKVLRNAKLRGVKWIFTMEDGSKFSCKSASAASYSAIKAWAMTWDSKPIHIGKGENGSNKVVGLTSRNIDDRHMVYFVKLLTFEVTRSGKLYYKIGKSKNIPRRIRQFGPCLIIDTLEYEHYSEAFEAESRLHRLFSHLRMDSTEIFLLSDEEVGEIRIAIESLRNNEGDSGAYAKRENMRW
jgi:hypothetical protein